MPGWDLPIDRSEIPQHLLDLESRPRTNPFPWRGQFSPGLVEVLLARYASPGALVLDPFAGVGTTLIEAARRNLPATGVEINPAAVAMAETARFVNVPRAERERLVSAALLCLSDCELLPGRIAAAGEWATRNILVNTFIRAIEGAPLLEAFQRHAAVILDLPQSDQPCRVAAADARLLPVAAATVDLILASPPYINVFNYHQNCRQAMELLGWDLLTVARSEFGANRKHRGNRFLTVIQYALDMHAALAEARRAARDSALMILVVGRESSVRGISFRNGQIVSAVARAAGWELTLRQQRSFRNKFGGVIREDILHFRQSAPRGPEPREIALAALAAGLAHATDAPVRRDLESAIRDAVQVQPSPLYGA